jgi:hypothetical protein
LTRRSLLEAAGAMGLLALMPSGLVRSLISEARAAGGAGRFLNAHELDTLRGVTARFVPGPPEDPAPGALEAGVAEAIDLLLGAFDLHPPPIHAGGPYSNRAGAHHDDFADFVALDPHAELGWRIRIEGSRGIAAREFAGPVTGLQEIYRSGLAHLDDRARAAYGVDFAGAPAPAQDALLTDQSDAQLQAFVGAALANTLEAMYGPPEYGGNRGLAGWTPNGWSGDRQPDGFTASQVSNPDPGLAPRTAGTESANPELPRTTPTAVERAALADQSLLVALWGRRASRDAPWLARRGLNGR